ncbi:MAG: M23 family metallopeptidase [Acidimicrobiia bacterium]
MRPLLPSLAVGAALLIPTTVSSAIAADGHPTLTCFPLAPAEIRYDNTWGAARSGGRRHQGIDIMAPKRTVVMAVAGGLVETLDAASGAGYYIRLVHEGGWETWYMHLDNDTAGTDDGRGGAATAYADGLEVGDEVVAGQIIGYVGDSGNAEWTGPHLHFELHTDGYAVNPYPSLIDADARITRLRQAVEPIVPTAVADEVVADPIDISMRPDAGCLDPSIEGRRPIPADDVPAEVLPVTVR